MSTRTKQQRIRRHRQLSRSRKPKLERLEQRTLLATIQGTIYEDLNGDRDLATDPPLNLPEMVVYLDQNQNGVLDDNEISTHPDADGSYEFSGLTPGDYFVAQQPPANWLQTTPTPAAAISEVGRPLTSFDLTSVGEDIRITGMTRDEDTGLLYLSSYNENRIYQIYPIDPTTGQVPQEAVPFALPGTNMWAITFDSATQTFWGADRSDNDYIIQFRQSTTDATQPEVLQEFQVSDPETGNIVHWDGAGIAWDSTDDTVWVMDWSSEKIFHVDPETESLLSSFAAPKTAGSLFGLAFDGEHLWTNRWDDSGSVSLTYEFDRSGQLLRSFSPPAVKNSRVTGLAYGGQDAEGQETLWLAQIDDQTLFQVDVTAPGVHHVSLTASDTVVADCNFGNFQLATITGTVYEDLNMDGVQGSDEPGLAGWEVSLDINEDGQSELWESLVLTDTNGNYTISGVFPGIPSVTVTQREPGWNATTELVQPISVESSGVQIGEVDFGQQLRGLGPYGGEITVGLEKNGDVYGGAIASDASGGFAIVWSAYGSQDTDGLGVYVRLFNAAGNARTDDILVNQSTAGDQSSAKIGMADNGEFVVAWQDSARPGVVVARQFHSNGNPISDEFLVYNDRRRNFAIPVTVGMDAVGNFAVLVYAHEHVEKQFSYNRNHIYEVRRFDSEGNAIGSPITVSKDSNDNIRMAMADNGSFVLAGTEPETNVWVQQYGPDGTAIGDRRVAATTTWFTEPQVDISADGNFFAVLWQEEWQGQCVARISDTGSWTSDVFSVDNGKDSYDKNGNSLRIGIDQDGTAVVLSDDTATGWVYSDLWATRFDSGGAQVGNTFLVNTTPGGRAPGNTTLIEMTDTGGFIAGWHVNGDSGNVLSQPDYEGVVAQLYINSAEVNHSPVAMDDTVTVDEDSLVSINVLANDTDADGDLLAVDSFSQGANGTVVDSGGGMLTYTPAANFNGNDSFSYSITDGQGGTDTATVSVTVNAVNDAPVAVDDSAITELDMSVTIDLLANDSDVDGDPLSVTAVDPTSASAGSITDNDDGTVTYMPPADWTGSDTFSYTVSDGNGGSDTATVTVTVTMPNSAPVATDDGYTTNEDSQLVVPAPGVLSNDTDADNDPLTAVLATEPSNGTVTLNANGSFTYTPNTGFVGNDSFTYTVSDGNGGIDTATVAVAVQATSPTSLHVADLDGTATSVNKRKWAANVTVTVLDNTGTPVSDATVEGAWSNGVSSIATTDSSGTVTVPSGNIDTSTSSVQFNVTSITHATLTYDVSANEDPDGDSNGTTIMVYQDGSTDLAQSLTAAGDTDPLVGAELLTEDVASIDRDAPPSRVEQFDQGLLNVPAETDQMILSEQPNALTASPPPRADYLRVPNSKTASYDLAILDDIADEQSELLDEDLLDVLSRP